MEKINIKEYGGEVNFTTDVCRNHEWSSKLLEAVDYTGEFKMQYEVPTAGSKRIDLVATDTDDNVLFAIECQDATGWLDDVHASKIMLYGFDQGTEDCVIICEDLTEKMRDFVKYMNATSNFKIYIVHPEIYKHGDDVSVNWFTSMRPYDTKQKVKVLSNKESMESKDSKLQSHQSIHDAYPGQFNKVAQEYVSMQNVGKYKMNVDLLDSSASFLLRVKGKAEMTKTDKNCEELAFMLNDSGLIDFEWRNNTSGAFVRFSKDEFTLEQVAEFHKNTVDFCNSLAIL